MSRVEIQLDVQYVKCGLAPEQVEWDPELRVFLTGHFERRATRIQLELGAQPTSHRVAGSRNPDLGDIPATAALVFMGIAKHRNDQGVPCMIDAGTSHIMLSELTKHNWSRDGPFQKDIHLLMHTAKNFDKGVVRVTVHRPEHVALAGLKIAAMHIDGPSAGKEMMEYMQRCMDIEVNMGDTLRGTSNVRCPFDFSQAGWQLTGVPTPAQGYVLNPERPRSNGLFWANAFERIMARDGRKTADWAKMNKMERARMTIKLVVYPVQYMPYIGDKIDRNRRGQVYKASLKTGMEDFGDALVMWSGDCEDLAKVMSAFLAYDFNTRNGKAQTPYDATFREMKVLMDQYVPIMSLEVVHGAKAEDHTESYGAHMSDVVLPAHYAKACMERTADGKVLSKKLPWPKDMDTTLPVELGEGTGMLDPQGYVDSLHDVRLYLCQAPITAGFKKDIINNHGEPSAKQGWTPYFALRGATDGQGDAFWFTTEPQGTRGALYTSFDNEKDDVGLRPMPRMPERVQELSREATMFRAPPDDLVLSDRHIHTRNKLLDKAVETIASTHRDLGPGGDRPSVTVPLYISPHQLDEHVAEKLGSQLAQLDRVWKLDYECESVVDGMHGWRLLVHVHVDRIASANATSH